MRIPKTTKEIDLGKEYVEVVFDELKEGRLISESTPRSWELTWFFLIGFIILICSGFIKFFPNKPEAKDNIEHQVNYAEEGH